MKNALFTFTFVSLASMACALAPTPEFAEVDPVVSSLENKDEVASNVSGEETSTKKLAMTTITGEFTIVAPPTQDLLKVLEAINETNANPNNSMGEWQASFLKNTRRIRDLVETGAIAEASFKIDSSSELVAANQ